MRNAGQQAQGPQLSMYRSNQLSSTTSLQPVKMLLSCTVQDLAAATQDEVNDMWAGLGYYRRARLLLAGAQHIQSEMSGQMPLTAQELLKIPGENC